jgi:GTPase SAR1 family protein
MPVYKVCLIGDSNVGKTTIMNSYLGIRDKTPDVTVYANYRAIYSYFTDRTGI